MPRVQRISAVLQYTIIIKGRMSDFTSALLHVKVHVIGLQRLAKFWRRGNTCSLWLQERDGYRILEVQSSEVRSSSGSGSLMAILPYYVLENYYSDMYSELSFPYNIMLVNGFQVFFGEFLQYTCMDFTAFLGEPLLIICIKETEQTR